MSIPTSLILTPSFLSCLPQLVVSLGKPEDTSNFSVLWHVLQPDLKRICFSGFNNVWIYLLKKAITARFIRNTKF